MEVENHLEDDGSPQLIAVDDLTSSAMWIRVGPIYDGDTIRDQPGVWIEYQDRYINSDLRGPVLLSIEVWNELDKAVKSRIAKFDKEAYGGI